MNTLAEQFKKGMKEFDEKFNIMYPPRKGHFGQEWDKVPMPEIVKAHNKSQFLSFLDEIEKWVDNYEKLRCGKGDGAKLEKHALWCIFRKDLKSYLTEARKKVN